MKRTLLLCLLALVTARVSGQSRELSLSLSNYRIETIEDSGGNGSHGLISFEGVNRLFNMGYGYYIPVYNPAPNFGLGVNATITGGIRWSSDADHEIYADLGLPVTATLRYGAGATREAYSPVGVGIGAGYRLNAVLVPDGDPFYVEDDPVVLTFFRPFMFVELVLDYQKRDHSFFDNLKIQFSIQPVYSHSNYASDLGININSKMHYYSISFIRFNAFN